MFQIVNFAIVVYLLYRLLFRPVKEIILKRQETLKNERETLSKEKNAIATLKKELDEKLTRLDELKKTIIEETRAEAEMERQRILEETSKEIEAKWEGLERQIEEKRKTLQETLRMEAIELTRELSKNLLHTLWDEQLNERLVKKTIAEIGSLDKREVQAILSGYEGCVVEVSSASELKEDIKRDIYESITHLFGCSPDIKYQVAPEYIGGIAVRINSRVFDGTVLGNIERATDALK